MSVSITLGGINFIDFQAPQELPGVGGIQQMAEKKFPGGAITQQELGAFPHDLTWSGYMTGPQAFANVESIDALRAAGQDIILEYGLFAWIGKIKDFNAKPRHQFLVPYTITFAPSQDLSPSAQIGSGLGLAAIFAGELTNYGFYTAGTTGLSMPSSLSAPTTTFSSSISTGLTDASGVVAAVSSADIAAIQTAYAGIQTAANTLIAGTDATQASPALDIKNYSANLAVTVGAPGGALSTTRTFPMINPNLFSLAQQYYGDASLWQAIASASGITDPQPIGQITVVIPPLS